MSPEDIEKTTIENARAIGELTVIAKQTSKDVDKLITHLDTVPLSRIVSMEKRVAKTEESVKSFISGSVVRWGIGGLITMIGLYVVHLEDVKEDYTNELHRLDKLVVEKIHTQKQINKNVEDRPNRNDDFLGLERTNIRMIKYDQE